jgi:glycosyltransferase involved in cell wall biosynthesis
VESSGRSNGGPSGESGGLENQAPGPIAVVIDPWDHPYNGTVVSTRRFVESLSRAGYRFRLLSITGPGGDPAASFKRLSLPGVNRIIDAMRAPLARPERDKVRRLLAGCGLLHVQYPFFLAYSAVREARLLGIPVVCSFHVQPENILANLRISSRALTKLLYRLFVRCLYARADQVIAPSGFAADLLRAHGLQVPITVLSNGVPERFFKVRQARAVQRPASGAPYRLLSVGRLAREKQQETLLRAVARSRYRQNIELVLAGVGPRQGYLTRLAQELGVRARIGWIDDDELLDMYGRADLFVHTGTIELEGMSVLEAMAAGNCVIVSDSRDSACVPLVDEADRFRMGDSADLAWRIDFMLERPELRVEAGERNRRKASGFSHSAASRALMGFYDGMLAPVGSVQEPRLTGTP